MHDDTEDGLWSNVESLAIGLLGSFLLFATENLIAEVMNHGLITY